MILTPSDRCFELVKKFEGYSPKVYKDQAGVMTIGYGHTSIAVKAGDTVTVVQAISLLKADMDSAAISIRNAVRAIGPASLNQNQFDALCSLVYNIGQKNWQNSTLLRQINASAGRNEILEALEFPRWRFVGGVPSKGLLRRRMAEAELFLTP